MKPNIIVFMTDHQRGDTMMRHSKAITPNIDRFREQAVTFNNAYCPSPHCCPSRATFFTGTYPSEHGVWNNVNVSNALSRGLFEDVDVFSNKLKSVGYNLYFSGKWHVSAEQGPGEFGFEPIFHNTQVYKKYSNKVDINEWKLYTEGKHNVDTGKEERTEGRIIREGYEEYIQYGVDEKPYSDLEVVEAVVEKLDNVDKEQPFFIFAGTVGPHDPYKAPQKFIDLYDINDIELPPNYDDNLLDKPHLYQRTKDRYGQLTDYEHRESIRHFYAFCSYEDYLFGKILDKVEMEGLIDNTLIVYVSDHGDYVGSHGLWAKGLPCFKEAYNVCSMIGGGLVKDKNRIDERFISLADYAPTFLELAGVEHNIFTMGKSLVPFIKNLTVDNWREEMYTQSNGNEIYGIQRSVFNKKWKYVFNTFDFDELYDLENDPGELINLLHGVRNINESKYSRLVKEMCKKMWNFAYENKDACVNSYIMTALAPFGPGIIFNEEGER